MSETIILRLSRSGNPDLELHLSRSDAEELHAALADYLAGKADTRYCFEVIIERPK